LPNLPSALGGALRAGRKPPAIEKAILHRINVIHGRFYPIPDHLNPIGDGFYPIGDHLNPIADGFYPLAHHLKAIADGKKVIGVGFK
jgi:hypothetical protein